MNKRITRKVFATLTVATLFTFGLMAQTPITGYDNGASGSNYVSTATQATTQVTLGKSIPLFAQPDVYYHPSYDPITGNGITAGFTWTWSTNNGNVTLGGMVANYAVATGAVLGTTTVSVAEASAFCTDATPQTMDVTVLATPTFSITAPLANIEVCSGDPSLATGVTATIVNNNATQFRLVWSLEIFTQSGSPMAADEWFDSDKTTSLGAAQAFAENYTQAVPQNVAAAGAVNVTSATLPYTTIGGKTTVYTYTLTAINDVVTRRGDFIGLGAAVNATPAANFMYYDVAGVNPLATNDVVTITVHPTPATGPIYHISNTWAN